MKKQVKGDGSTSIYRRVNLHQQDGTSVFLNVGNKSNAEEIRLRENLSPAKLRDYASARDSCYNWNLLVWCRYLEEAETNGLN